MHSQYVCIVYYYGSLGRILTFNPPSRREDLASLEKARQALHGWLQFVRHEFHLETVEGVLGLADILFTNGQARAVDPNGRGILETGFEDGGRIGFGRPVSLVAIGILGLFVSHVHGRTVLARLAKDDGTTTELLGKRSSFVQNVVIDLAGRAHNVFM